MATALRFSNAALRPALTSIRSPAKAAAFNGLRCYSSAKTQVSLTPTALYELADWSLDTQRVIRREAPRRDWEDQETEKRLRLQGRRRGYFGSSLRWSSRYQVAGLGRLCSRLRRRHSVPRKDNPRMSKVAAQGSWWRRTFTRRYKDAKARDVMRN